MNPSSQQVIGVKAFVAVLNETLGFAFPVVTVEGEVHSFKVNQGKWVFFDLKDDEASLACFMPVQMLKVPLEDGMKVRVTGSPKLTKWGKFSFTARSVELAGEGELRRAFELLKQRLRAEGLFDAARKRPLPKFPTRIGLITSATSAAYSDFMKILGQRWGGIRIELTDVQVQGTPAPGQIVAALNYFNELAKPVDVLVVIRGGGSLEDLQAFNTEEVARGIATSRTPTVVGVGHEVDTSLADFAADVRAATPTDAARLVVPDRHEIGQTVAFNHERLERGMAARLESSHRRLERLADAAHRFLAYPRQRVESQEALLRRESYRLELRVVSLDQTLSHVAARIADQQYQLVDRTHARVESLGRVLQGFDPEANLRRGYAIVRHDADIIRAASQVSSGDHLMIQLGEGTVSVQAQQQGTTHHDHD